MATPGIESFHEHVTHLFKEILSSNSAAIDAAAEVLVEVIRRDGIIHVVGTGGHSQIPAMEMFWRAGGLANVSIMFPPGLGLFDGKPCLERVEGMGGYTMAYHDVRKEDAVIISNFYGMNAATVDLALAARKRQVPTIGITSVAFARNTPADFRARHACRRNLCDLVDITIDTHTSREEQVVAVPGVAQKVAAASSLAGCFIVQWLTLRTVERARERGIDPPLWMCANLPGGDETNERLLRKYMPRMRHLYPEGEAFSGSSE